MSMRDAEIKSIFMSWLERYSPPRNMNDNPSACQAEASALLRIFAKFAPHVNVAAWCREATDLLDEQMKTRAWPTVNEVGAVCRNLQREKLRETKGRSGDDRNTPEQINAAHILAGEPVGVFWIYGRCAAAIIKAGLVRESDLERHRTNWFHSLIPVYGREAALVKEAEMRARHRSAMEDGQSESREVNVPDKSMPIPEGFYA
jgi:hypothetical protein